MTPLSNMSPDDMRVAMALLEGWKNIRTRTGGNVYFGEPDDDWNRDAAEFKQILPHRELLPEYLASLDAVAQIEARLTDEEYDRFENFLGKITGLISDSGMESFRFRVILSATALQRTKAILLATEKATL